MACDAVEQGYEMEDQIGERQAIGILKQCFMYNGEYVQLEGGNVSGFKPVSIREGGDGIYTYIFDQDKMLHTARVENQFEINSLHNTLVYKGHVKRVRGGGELKKEGNKITFNLLSGSFMKDWMQDVLDGTCDDKVQESVKQLFRISGYEDCTYTTETLINKKNVPLTKAQLDGYVKAGVTVKLYSSRKHCMTEPDVIRGRITELKKSTTRGLESMIQKAEEELLDANKFTVYQPGGKRKMSRKYCRRTTCKKMGFSQKASCRPYKNCFTRRGKQYSSR
jgi:hypothetical protein